MSKPIFQIKELSSSSNSSDKQTKFIVIVGTNGTGKSTFCAQLIERTVLAGGRALIVVPDVNEWPNVPFIKPAEIQRFKRVVKVVFDLEATFEMLQNYKHGLLVFDDCRAYIQSSLNDQLHNLLIRRRQNDVNIIGVGHGFTEIPPKFFTFASHIAVFRTVDSIARRKNCLRDFDKMSEVVQIVNNRASTEPHFFRVVKQ